MSKDVLYQKGARERLMNGVNKLADAVAITLGPKGRNAIIYRESGSPLITNDGISIAKEIAFPDKFEQMGAQIVIEAAGKTNEIVGDGTTTATVLTRTIASLGIDACEEGANPVLIRKGIEKATEIAIKELDTITISIDTEKDIKNVATISSASEEIGEHICNAIKEIGEDGVITTAPSHTLETSVIYQKGYEFDRGLISPALAMNKEKGQTTLNDVKIMVTDQKINSFGEILPLCEELIYHKQPALFIVEDIAPLALQSLIANVINGNLAVAVVKAPGMGKLKKEILEDIAIKVGSEFIVEDSNKHISDVRLKDLGLASQAIIDMNKTVLIDSSEDSEKLKSRINSIKEKIESNEISEYDKDKYVERLAKLSGGVATILVGAATDLELQERTLRIEDAINATKVAISGGIVAGGGAALFYIANKIEKEVEDTIKNKDELKGANALLSSMCMPFIQIILNAGEDAVVMVKELLKYQTDADEPCEYGYDAYEDTFCNLVDKGIIDPAKVTRNALLNASSIAGVFITTDVAIASIGNNL